MAVISKSFTAAGTSSAVFLKKGESAYYEYRGTYSAVFQLEYSNNSGVSYSVATSNSTDNASSSGVYYAIEDVILRFNCLSSASGTVVTKLVNKYSGKLLLSLGGLAKAGTTAGFVVAAGNNLSLVTCPASQTASTLVMPLPYLKEGQIIKGFHLVGQVESGGNTVTIDCELRKGTAAAADVTDSSVASMTQLSVAADTLVNYKNTTLDGLREVVGEDNNYYFLITATTGASTDIALQSVALITE